MNLDDVYGSDSNRFPREQKANWRDKLMPELEWDESEVTALVDEITCRHATTE